ncbi:hypothetical protein BG011_002800 [Mortierella polycephala]|uniref:Uncharacterized protein n=1 Tax=Mortierella polycephala TaxID=41804 RepID=A0A9P6Q2J7_9FUNG|nr:hypothetical protein BG011_002800 [Mortierella polycephala]
MTSTRPREGRGVRHAAGGDHDRLKRAVLQPVQCWDKKWTESKNGKQLKVFKWVKCKGISNTDRQVDFDDDDEDEEIEQAPAPRQTEEEVGTPAPALPTLQDADDTTPSTPAQTGEEDDEEDTDNQAKSVSTQPYNEIEKRAPSTTHPEKAAKEATGVRSKAPQSDRDGDDDEDTDSGRPLVFTPSLETPIETQANTPQDFESMSPAPIENDELNREAEVELVVKGLDEGQAEMEEEMEEVVVKEKEHLQPPTDDSANPKTEDQALQSMDAENKESTIGGPTSDSVAGSSSVVDENRMDVDPPQPTPA